MQEEEESRIGIRPLRLTRMADVLGKPLVDVLLEVLVGGGRRQRIRPIRPLRLTRMVDVLGKPLVDVLLELLVGGGDDGDDDEFSLRRRWSGR